MTNEANLKYHGEVFLQLLASDRFKQFVELNYEIRRIIDDEEKTITVEVLEKPPEVVMQSLGGKPKKAKKPGIKLATQDDLTKLLKKKR